MAVTIPGGISPNSLTFSSQQNRKSSAVISNQISGASAAIGVATVVGADNAQTPFHLTSGNDGLYFISGTSSVGGTASLAGGNNTLIGGHPGAPAGLLGNWAVTTGGGSTEIWLGTGSDSLALGGADTVHAGSASVLITSSQSSGTVIDPGAGFVTFAGGNSGNARVLPGGTGGGLYQMGSGGGNVAYAGTGNTTLIGGGGGDKLYANTVTGAAGTVVMASGNDTLIGGGNGTDTFFGYSSISGNGNALIDVSKSPSGQSIWLGGGNDTVRLGTGADTVVASAQHTDGVGTDRLIGWNINQDVLQLSGYGYGTGKQPLITDTKAGLNLSLSDGTNIVFSGLHNAAAIKITFG